MVFKYNCDHEVDCLSSGLQVEVNSFLRSHVLCNDSLFLILFSVLFEFLFYDLVPLMKVHQTFHSFQRSEKAKVCFL